MFSECKQYVGCIDEDEIDQNSTFAVLQNFFSEIGQFYLQFKHPAPSCELF